MTHSERRLQSLKLHCCLSSLQSCTKLLYLISVLLVSFPRGNFQLIVLPYLMALCILFLTLLSLCCGIDAVSQQGRVGLWSDSECNSKSRVTSNFGEPDPIALNFTLLPDSCGVPGATVHSYRVLQKAICANGSTATFSAYNSNNCTADPTDENPILD